MILTIFLGLLSGLCLGASNPSIIARKNEPKFLFVLGDSYSNIAFDPNGALPSPSNPFGNTDDAARTPENVDLTTGPNWVNDVTTTFNSSPLMTYDYAVDCAVVNKTLIPQDCDFALNYNFINQTNAVERTFSSGSQYGKFNQDNTLFAIFIGINDASIPPKYNPTNLESTLSQAVGDLFVQLDRIYQLGVRKFVLFSVPPYDRTPQVQSTNNSLYIKSQQQSIATWNTALLENYNAWTKKNTDLTSVYFDTTAAFNHVLDNPTQFGAGVNGTQCVGPPACLWADDFHPGPALHKYLAKSMVDASSSKFPDFFTATVAG